MKLSILLLAVAAGLPVLGQDFSVALFSNQFKTLSKAYLVPAADNTVSAGYSSGWLASNGLQGAWRVAKAGPLGIEVTGACMFPATYALTEASSWSILTGSGNASATAHFRESYGAVGARLAGTVPFVWSVGLEVRAEYFRLSNGYENVYSAHNNATVSIHQNRPWIVGRIGYAFPGIGIHPFVAASLGISQSKAEDIPGNFDADLLKAMAPNVEFGVQAGLRF